MTVAIALVALAASSGASGKDADPIVWRQTPEWYVEQSPEFCAMTASWPDKTEVSLALNVDGRVSLVAANPGWTKASFGLIGLSFKAGSRTYGDGDVKRSDDGETIGTTVQGQFLADMQATGQVGILKEDGSVIFSGVFGNGAEGIGALRSCVLDIKRKARGTGAAMVTRPKLSGSGQIVATDDYPPAALRSEAQGRTGIRLDVSAMGVVSGCAVTSTSGNADLDAASCRLFTRRARYTPALDAAGRETIGTVDTAVTWRLPSDPPPLPAAK